MGRDEEKSGGGQASRPREGDFHASPLAKVGHRRPFFRRHVVVAAVRMGRGGTARLGRGGTARLPEGGVMN